MKHLIYQFQHSRWFYNAGGGVFVLFDFPSRKFDQIFVYVTKRYFGITNNMFGQLHGYLGISFNWLPPFHPLFHYEPINKPSNLYTMFHGNS